MTEILTESFCERCGTRYTFESARPKPRLKGVRVLSRGLKNFVLSDDTSMDEAMAAARNETDREQTAQQLDAFHKTFNFCMSCRQYTCPNCWNEVEARCLSCAPNLGREVLPAPFPDLPSGPLVAPDAIALSGSNGWNGSNGATPAAEMIGLAEVRNVRQDAEVDAAARLAALTAPIEAPVAEAPPEVPEDVAVESPAAVPEPAQEPVADLAVDAPTAERPTLATPPDVPAEIVGMGVAGATPATDGGAFDAAAATVPFDETAPEDLTAGDMAGFAVRLAAASGVAQAVDGAAPERTEPPKRAAAPADRKVAPAGTSDKLAAAQPEPVAAVEPEPVAAVKPALEAAAFVAPESEIEVVPVAAVAADVPEAEAEEPPAGATLAAAAAFVAATPALPEEPVATAAPETEVAPETVAIETADDSLAAAAAAGPAAAVEPPAPVVDDVVRQPMWQMVAPDSNSAPIEAPATPTSTEPQWPARPEWPTAGNSAGLPFLGRPAAPQGGLEALWAESTREVVATPTPSGRPAGVVQPCVRCGLSLSANARFCRRCGTAQGG